MSTLPPAEQAALSELQRRVEATTRVVVRPIGSPLALGLFGLTAATFVLAGLQLGWVEPAEGKKVALALLLFALPAQVVAGILSFLARDGTTATAMSELGLIWGVIGMTLLTSQPGSESDALGLFLLFAATSMTVTAITISSAKLVAAAVFGTAALRFLLAGIFELTSNKAWEHASGVVGLFLAALALYAASASELEDAQKRTVLPLARRGEGKTAVTADTLVQQVQRVHKDAGVRPKL